MKLCAIVLSTLLASVAAQDDWCLQSISGAGNMIGFSQFMQQQDNDLGHFVAVDFEGQPSRFVWINYEMSQGTNTVRLEASYYFPDSGLALSDVDKKFLASQGIMSGESVTISINEGVGYTPTQEKHTFTLREDVFNAEYAGNGPSLSILNMTCNDAQRMCTLCARAHDTQNTVGTGDIKSYLHPDVFEVMEYALSGKFVKDYYSQWSTVVMSGDKMWDVCGDTQKFDHSTNIVSAFALGQNYPNVKYSCVHS